MLFGVSDAIEAVVIVEIPLGRLGVAPQPYRDHDGHPNRDGRRRAASRFGLRPARLAAMKDLHHFLGHQRSGDRQAFADHAGAYSDAISKGLLACHA